MNKNIIGGSIVLIIIVLLFLMVAGSMVASVKPGYGGVVYNRFGGENAVEPGSLGQGWNMVAPWKTVTQYPVSKEFAYYTAAAHEARGKTDDSMKISTKDGREITVELMVAYQFLPNKLGHIYNLFRGASVDEIEYGFMKQTIRQELNAITSQYAMIDLAGDKQPEIMAKLSKRVHEVFGPDGIDIKEIGFTKVEPDGQTREAIQQYINAQNTKRQAEVEKQTAEIHAEQARIKAKGDADARFIRADGEAKANERLQVSITPQLIEYVKANRWDGKNSSTILSTSTQPIVNLGH
jgi:regulator of protease activity HflC (stomatin/prohibitin superfamily)